MRCCYPAWKKWCGGGAAPAGRSGSANRGSVSASNHFPFESDEPLRRFNFRTSVVGRSAKNWSESVLGSPGVGSGTAFGKQHILHVGRRLQELSGVPVIHERYDFVAITGAKKPLRRRIDVSDESDH